MATGERAARERAAIKILLYGIPSSPGGVGPAERLARRKEAERAEAKPEPKRDEDNQRVG